MTRSRRWIHLVAGAAGGMAAAFFTSPLDVLRTRLQTKFYKSHTRASPSQSPASHLRETWRILIDMQRTEGWRAYFKGIGPTLSGANLASAIKFYTCGNSKRILSDTLNQGRETAWIHLVAAATAGITVSTATNPIWVVKTRLQLDRSSVSQKQPPIGKFKGSLDGARQTLRNEGVRGLYRGLSASYLGVAERTLHWVLYEQAKLSLARKGLSRHESFWDVSAGWSARLGAAGGAKLVAALIMYPHEVVRTRLREIPGAKPKYTGLFQCFGTIWREEGFAALYGGLIAHILRVVPSTAIIFGVCEVVLKAAD